MTQPQPYTSEAEFLKDLDSSVNVVARKVQEAGVDEDLSILPSELADFGFGPEPGDEKLRVRFYDQPVRNERKSQSQKRSAWDSVLIVEVHMPTKHGKGCSSVTQITDDNKDYWIARFPAQWRAYKAGASKGSDDTRLLSKWAYLSEIEVRNLVGFKITTIDELAAATEEQIRTISKEVPNFSEKVEKAKRYVEFLANEEKLSKSKSKK